MRRLYVLLCVSLAATCTTGLERRRRALLQGGPPEQIASTPIYQTHQGTSKDGGANVRACPRLHHIGRTPLVARCVPDTRTPPYAPGLQQLTEFARFTFTHFASSPAPLPLSSPPWHLLTPHFSLHLLPLPHHRHPLFDRRTGRTRRISRCITSGTRADCPPLPRRRATSLTAWPWAACR